MLTTKTACFGFTFLKRSGNDHSPGLAEMALFTAAFMRVQLKQFHLDTSKIFFMQTQIHMHAFLLLRSWSFFSFPTRTKPSPHHADRLLLCQLISASDGCIVALCKSIYIGIALFGSEAGGFRGSVLPS